jgi:nucleoside-diphosphate-sugar epimerase
MTTAFVTGGSGFVGRTLISALVQAGWTVRALARSESAMRVVEAVGAEPVPGDLGAVAAMTAGMSGCDVVFHAAAKVDDWGRPEEFVEVNVAGTQHVVAAARAAAVPRLVHVSTEAVLTGSGPIVQADETRPRSAHPIGSYATTKALAEEVVEAANGLELQTVIVRPRLIWGPDDTTLLPLLVDSVEHGRYRWVDRGRYLTSTCHVRNVCAGLIAAAERGRPGEIYFLTDGDPVEFRMFVEHLLATQGVVAGSGSIPRRVAQAAAVASEGAWRLLRRPGTPPVTRASVALAGEEVTVVDRKAREEIDYQPVITIADGLTELADNHFV